MRYRFQWLMVVFAVWCAGSAMASAVLEQLTLNGNVASDRCEVVIEWQMQVEAPGRYELVTGALAPLAEAECVGRKESFWRSAPAGRVIRSEKTLVLEADAPGWFRISLKAVLPVTEQGAQRSVSLEFPAAIKAGFALQFAPNQVDFRVLEALNTTASATALSGLWGGGNWQLDWKVAVDEHAGLVVGYDSSTVAAVDAGTVRRVTDFHFFTTQGELRELRFAVPEGNLVNAVEASCPLERWYFDRERQLLSVWPVRNFPADFRLSVRLERALAGLPEQIVLKPLLPEEARQNNAEWLIGAGPGIKLTPVKLGNLIQTAGIPQLEKLAHGYYANLRQLTSFHAAGDFEAVFEAAAIMPVYTSESETAIQLKEGVLAVRYDGLLTVRDAPLKEVTVEYDGTLEFNRLQSDFLRPQDYELETAADGRKAIRLQFPKEITGTASFSLHFELDLKKQPRWALSGFEVVGARGGRGTLLVTAEPGLQLAGVKSSGITPVHPDTLAVRVAGLLQAYLYRESGWKLAGSVEVAPRHITGEVFSLVSAGEGGTFGLTLFPFHLGGAPADRLVFRISDRYENVEFSGAPLARTRKIDDKTDDGFYLFEVYLRGRHSGDLVLLASYEISSAEDGVLPAGAIGCVGAEPEARYIAVSGLKSMNSATVAANDAQEIEADELPAEYRSMINNSLLQAFRSADDLGVAVKLNAFAKEPLPPLLVTYADYRTRIAASGQAVTEALYQVKNATAQFLQLRLPPAAQLWQVKVNGVSERASVADGVLLIPLGRPLDINELGVVEISYAQTFEALADGRKIDFALPEVLAPVQRRQSQLELPGDFTIRDGQAAGAPASGLGALLSRPVLRLAARTLPLWGLGVICGLVTLLLSYGLARRRRSWSWAGAVLGAGFLVIWTLAAVVSFGNIRHWGALAPMPVNVAMMAEAADFGMASTVIPLDICRVGSAPVMAWGSLIAAGIVLAVALALYGFKRWRWPLIWGGAVTAALVAVWAVQSPAAMMVLVLAGAAGGALVVPLAFNIACYRYWKRTALFLLLTCCTCLAWAKVDDYRIDLKLDGENVIVQGTLHFQLDADEFLQLTIPGVLLTDWQIPEDCTILKNAKGAWFLKAARNVEGVATFHGLRQLIDIKAGRGVSVWLPEAFRGTVVVAHDDTFFWNTTRAIAMDRLENADVFRFDNTIRANFFWLTRRTAGEQAVELQANFESTLSFRRDAVFADIQARISIPQGQVNELTFVVPEGLSVTQVEALELNTWRFDAESRQLKLYFNQWLPAESTVALKTARHWNALPQQWQYRVPHLAGARLEYGSALFFSSPDVRVAIQQAQGATPMEHRAGKDGIVPVAAFHYGEQAEFQLAIEDVKPELRVEEQTEVRYEDERVTLSSQILLEVVKGGVFTADIELPAGFEVGSLAGIGNDDWEEVRQPGKSGVLRLHFRERLTGAVRFQLGLTRLADRAYATENVPRLTVVGATKLSGLLTVAAERGTTLSVTSREGAVLAESRPESSNSLVFKLLNPQWKLGLRFDATPPWIQVTTQQSVRMRLNNVDTELEASFKIENNGIKALTVQLPPNWTLPEFDGRFIGKMVPLADGRWQLEMTRKIDREYRLRIRGRLAPDEEGAIPVRAAAFMDTSAQSGTLAVYTSDSLELKTPSLSGDISEQNSRNLPPELSRLQSGSTPVAAFRTVGTQWQADLASVSNQAAGVIKATASGLSLATMLADTGVLLTRGTVTVENAGETFLAIALPEGGDFWGGKVNGIPVEAVRSAAGRILLPLEPGPQQVEFFYLIRGARPEAGYDGKLTGPQLEIPIKNIRWELFYPHGFTLRRTGGSLEERRELTQLWRDDYGSMGKGAGWNKEKLMLDGRNLTQSGDIQASNRMMQQALDMTADAAMRNDLAGEMLLNNREFNLSNISKRQSSLARSRAQSEPLNAPDMSGGFGSMQQGATGGFGAPQQAANPYLQEVADKIFTQQQAVYAAPQIFELAWSPAGTPVVFERAMEINRDAPLEVAFTLDGGEAGRDWRGVIVFAVIILGSALLLWGLVPKREKSVKF